MLVYGKNVALEYLSTKSSQINKLYISDKFNDENIIGLIQKHNIEPIILSKFKLDEIANGNHQGIIVGVPDFKYAEIDDITKKENALVLILDHLEDPHNLGAIIRTAEAAGVDGIIIPKDRSADVNSTVIKVSTGTINNVKIAKVTNLVRTINELKKDGFWITGTDMNGTNYDEIDYNGKVAIVIGNEGSGMTRLVKEACDFIASIPMKGKVNSLNASVAAGIIIFEANKVRR